MAQTVSGELVAAERRDKSCDFAGASRHERALERGVVQSVKNTRGDADDVLCRRADLAADEVGAEIEAYKIAVEFADKLLLDLLVHAVDDHAVRDSAHIVLRVSGADPYGDGSLALVNKVADDLAQTLARCNLNALHAQNDGFAVEVVFCDIRHI